LNQVIQHIETDLEVKSKARRHHNLFAVANPGRCRAAVVPTLLQPDRQLAQIRQDYIPPVITITAKPVADNNRQAVSITLTDNGIGFEPEYAHTIFNTFTRLNSKDAYDGTGRAGAL
jgi:light-regulated signal transduction histidine kinase (bacteriophytochrome)